MTVFSWSVRGRWVAGMASGLGSTLTWGPSDEADSGFPWPDRSTWPALRVLGVGFTLSTQGIGSGLQRRPVLTFNLGTGQFIHTSSGTVSPGFFTRRYEFWAGYERESTGAGTTHYREPLPHDVILSPPYPFSSADLIVSVENGLPNETVTGWSVHGELLLP